MKDILNNRLTEMSDAEFLSFLYSERDREESLTTYQGWNIWAIYGAIITILCAGYNILCTHHNEIDWLRTGYCLSGFFSFAFCYRFLVLFVSLFLERKRGVDIRKVRYLINVAPVPYLIVAVLCSVGFAIFFPLVNIENPWGLISILWIWMAVAYIIICFNVYIGKDNIVQPNFDGLTFSIAKLEKWVYTTISLISSIIWSRSFGQIHGPLIGSADIEIAVCIASFFFLLYLLIKIKISIKKSSQIDVLLDDYIYKERSKESVFMQLRSNRMGYGVVEACSQEVYAIKKSFDDFETQKEKAEEIALMLENGTIDFAKLPDCLEDLGKSSKYINNCVEQAKKLGDKLFQIKRDVPVQLIKEDCDALMTIVDAQLNRALEMSNVVDSATKALQMYWEEYGCNKYGGLCTKDCPHRHDKQTFAYRMRLWYMMTLDRIGAKFKINKDV